MRRTLLFMLFAACIFGILVKKGKSDKVVNYNKIMINRII